MKIYKLSDRIKIKINEVTVSISPLSFQQKSEIQGHMLEAAKGDLARGMEGARLAIKYAIKDIEGFEDSEGEKYKLEMENNILSDEDSENLLNTEMSNEIASVCLAFLSSVPSEIIDANTGEPMEGVEVILPKSKAQKKK